MASPPFLPDESKPGASDLISLYPSVEQTFRDIIEDWILVQHNTTGTHKQVTLDDISTPTIIAAKVGLWHTSGVLKTRFAGGTVYDMLTSNTGLKLTGGTMTGKITLDGVPTNDLHASTKKYVDDADALKANIASPALTGNPTAPTQSAGNNSTRLASTAFVTAAVTAGIIQWEENFTTARTTLSSIIPYDSTVPLVSEGVQIASIASVVVASNDQVEIVVDVSGNVGGNSGIVTLFRGSTCIAGRVDNSSTTGGFHSAWSFVDSPSAATYTYTLRVGANSSTNGELNARNTSAAQLFSTASMKSGFRLRVLTA